MITKGKKPLEDEETDNVLIDSNEKEQERTKP